MNEFLPPRETFVHTPESRLIIGGAALETALEAGVDPRDISGQLSDVLTSKERTVFPSTAAPMDAAAWDSADDIPTAIWLDGVCKSDPEHPAPLSEEAIVRAGYLGIVPRITYFKNRPGRIVGLYADAALENVRTRGLFDSWTNTDFVNYIHTLAKDLGRKPTIFDIRAQEHIAGNPSARQIELRFDRLGVLFELAGYADVHSWDTEDFLDWGVRFMMANDGLVPTSTHMTYLGNKKRALGPYHTAIYDHDDFSSILDFQTRVMDRYNQQKKLQDENESIIFNQLMNDELKNDRLHAIISSVDIDDEFGQLQAYARYLLVTSLGVRIDSSRLKSMCTTKRASYFSDTALQLSGQSLAEIETLAYALNVHELIWPADHTHSPLRIENWDQEEWEEIKQKKAA